MVCIRVRVGAVVYGVSQGISTETVTLLLISADPLPQAPRRVRAAGLDCSLIQMVRWRAGSAMCHVECQWCSTVS